MANLIEYAQVAARAYYDDRSPNNKPFIPDGWQELMQIGPQTNGFQAGVYTNGIKGSESLKSSYPQEKINRLRKSSTLPRKRDHAPTAPSGVTR